MPPGMKRWHCVWPTYLNSLKTTHKGRKVAKSIAVPNPTFKEILVVCAALGLECAAERKGYSRDFLDIVRVRVQLRRDDGSLCRVDIRNRRALLIVLAKGIAKLDHRVNPPPAVQAQTAGQTSGQQQQSKQKKKGKK